jgi:predicted TIM-barrel fold metal-dependent hydrolase
VRIALHTRVRADRMGAMTAMRIVDAHHHLWDLSVRDQDWIAGPALAPLRRDFPLADFQPLAASYSGVLQAARDLTPGLSPAEREAVFSGTATSIYGL